MIIRRPVIIPPAGSSDLLRSNIKRYASERMARVMMEIEHFFIVLRDLIVVWEKNLLASMRFNNLNV